MAIYIILYSIAFSGYLLGANRSRKNRRIYLLTMFSLFLLVASLRDVTVGTDLKYYYSKYYPQFANASWNSLQSVTISGDWEWGFCAFCKLLCYISTDVRLFIVVSSIVSIVPYGLFIEKNSKDVVFSTILYLGCHMFSMNLCVIRQAMAVGIILCGIDLLKQKKILKYCMVVLLATLFHSSAVICFALILCNYVKLKKNTMYLLAGAIIGLPLIYRVIFERILKISYFSSVYGLYNNNAHANGYITIHTLGMFAIMLLIFVVGFLGYKDRSGRESSQDYIVTRRSVGIKIGRLVLRMRKSVSEELTYSFLMYATYLATLFRMSAFIVNVTARLSLYFMPFAMILYPEALLRIDNANDKKIINFFALGGITAFALFIFAFRAESLWGIVPYSLQK